MTTKIMGNKPIYDTTLRVPKGTIRKVTFNTISFATQTYYIVEYLVQALCAMLFIEVLQKYPSQCRTLLSVIGVMDP
jgi:hypothetical protein